METSMMVRRAPVPAARRPPDPPPQRHHLDRRAAALAAEGAEAGDDDDLLTTTEVSEWLQISRQWLEIARSKNFGPPFVRLTPRRIRYVRASVTAWLRERQHRGTSEYSRRPTPEPIAAD